MARRLLTLLAFTLVLACGALLLVPVIRDQLARREELRVVEGYLDATAALPEQERNALRIECQTYNSWHRSSGIVDPFTRQMTSEGQAELLDRLEEAGGTGCLCVLEIPRLGVQLPVYRSADAQALEKGAMFQEGSGMPVGGEIAHTVLAAGRSGRRFARLERLQAGDVFTLRVLGETARYQVDRTEILPVQEIGAFNERGDIGCCTLIARARGAPDSRLLVRGRLMEDRLTAANDGTGPVPDAAVMLTFGLPVMAVGLAILLLRELFVRVALWARRKRLARITMRRRKKRQKRPAGRNGV